MTNNTWKYLEEELQNIVEVFIENGYSKKEIQDAMEEKETRMKKRMENETFTKESRITMNY